LKRLVHRARVLILIAGLSSLAACAHYIVQPLGSSTEGADHGAKRVPPSARTDDVVTCGEKDIYKVDVRYTIANTAGMILTAGLVPPTSEVAWLCGVPCNGDRVQVNGDAVRSGSKAAVSWLWSALPETVTVDCERAYLAKLDVSSNVGQRLISVLSLGVASPRTVTWECAPRCDTSAPFLPLPGAVENQKPGEAR